jgi:hypothetical protein
MIRFIGGMLAALAMAALALGLYSCNLSDRIQSSALTAVDSGSVLYHDDFSDPTSGWRVWDSDEALIDYTDGALRFLINQPNFDFWSLPGKRFADVTLAVEAELVAGPTDNDYGLICRLQDEYNFYAFLISSDGYGGILKVKDGLYQVLNSSTGLEYGSMIEQGFEKNLMRADCIGNRLTFYVNQEKFLEVEDSDFLVGEVGLLVGSYSQPGVDVHFDNYYVIKP